MKTLLVLTTGLLVLNLLALDNATKAVLNSNSVEKRNTLIEVDGKK